MSSIKMLLNVVLMMPILGTSALCATPWEGFVLNETLGAAYVKTVDDRLVVGTGQVERAWVWTGKGLATIQVKDNHTAKEWGTGQAAYSADWQYQDYTTDAATLTGLRVRISDDQGFTSPHLELVAEVAYEKVAVQYLVWIYPGTQGFRTQVKIKALQDLGIAGKPIYDTTAKDDVPNDCAASQILTGRTETIPVNADAFTPRGIGYYNHTQGRNKQETFILKDAIVADRQLAWASVLSLEAEDGGLILVKESHKCVNQAGVNTGIFTMDPNAVCSTGWGILPQDLNETYQGYWANWLIVHNATTVEERQLALKRFDRVRYPIDPQRDIYIMANTWGSGETKTWSQSAARQENVRIEIDSQADLGIDVQQIDDGWQGWATSGSHWRPVPELDYRTMQRRKGAGDGEVYDSSAPHYPMYPEGWQPIRRYAVDKGVRLGLWCHARIPLEDLKWNFDQGGFRSYKIDFVDARTYANLHGLMTKVRDFVLYTGQQVRINWDVTEHPPRMGYFFGREYGNIYLENRKTQQPAEVVYVPYRVLRDAWQLAHYLNLNKFQITVQNGERCNPEVSDAAKHRHDYLVAQTLMGSPIFFQETHYYSDSARAQIKPLLATYRQVRDDLYRGYVFPIGDLPDNRTWSGFQNIDPDQPDQGYLLVLRQIENSETEREIVLHFLSGKAITITDLMTGNRQTVSLGPEAKLPLTIAQPGGYRFLKYKVE